MLTTMLDPYGNEVLVDEPEVPPHGDADAPPFNAEDDRLEELLELSLLALQRSTRQVLRPGGWNHE